MPELLPLARQLRRASLRTGNPQSSPRGKRPLTRQSRDSDISDPLRNMIAAQAMTEGLVLITPDDCDDLLGLESLPAAA